MKKIPLVYSLLFLSFLLGIHEGRVALWKYEDPQPYVVFPYYAGLLPQKLQEALEKGIRIHDENQLAEILKDYFP